MSAEHTKRNDAKKAHAVGWMKYRNELPETKDTTVRTVSKKVPSSSIVDIRSPRWRRRPSAT